MNQECERNPLAAMWCIACVSTLNFAIKYLTHRKTQCSWQNKYLPLMGRCADAFVIAQLSTGARLPCAHVRIHVLERVAVGFTDYL